MAETGRAVRLEGDPGLLARPAAPPHPGAARRACACSTSARRAATSGAPCATAARSSPASSPTPRCPPSAREGYDDWRAADALAAGAWDAPFDAVVCADVLEHLPRPGGAARADPRLAARRAGRLFVSLPNVANVTVRAALALRPLPLRRPRDPRPHAPALLHAPRRPRELLDGCGFRVRGRWPPPRCPTSSRCPRSARAPWRGPVRAFASGSARVWPTLFGYQFVFESDAADEGHARHPRLQRGEPDRGLHPQRRAVGARAARRLGLGGRSSSTTARPTTRSRGRAASRREEKLDLRVISLRRQPRQGRRDPRRACSRPRATRSSSRTPTSRRRSRSG